MDVKKLVVWEWKVCFRFFFCKDKRARSWRNTHKCTHTDTQCLKKMSWNQQRNRKRERQSGNIMETMGSVRERERGCTHKHETFQDNISILKRCVCVCVCVCVCIHRMVLCSTCGSGDSVHLVFCVCIYAYIPWRSLLNTNVTWSVRLQNRVTDVQASVSVCVRVCVCVRSHLELLKSQSLILNLSLGSLLFLLYPPFLLKAENITDLKYT